MPWPAGGPAGAEEARRPAPGPRVSAVDAGGGAVPGSAANLRGGGEGRGRRDDSHTGQREKGKCWAGGRRERAGQRGVRFTSDGGLKTQALFFENETNHRGVSNTKPCFFKTKQTIGGPGGLKKQALRRHREGFNCVMGWCKISRERIVGDIAKVRDIIYFYCLWYTQRYRVSLSLTHYLPP